MMPFPPLDLDHPTMRALLAEGARRSQTILDVLAKNTVAIPPGLDTLLGLVLVAITLDVGARREGVDLPPFDKLCTFLADTYGQAQAWGSGPGKDEVKQVAQRVAAGEVALGEPIPVCAEIDAMKRFAETASSFVPRMVDAMRQSFVAQRVPKELLALVAIEAAITFAKLKAPGAAPPMTEDTWTMATTLLWDAIEVEAIEVPKDAPRTKGGDA